MSKRKEKLVLLTVDFLAINFVWLMYYAVRVESGLFSYLSEPDLWLPMLVVYVYWVILFFFFGLYRSWYVRSRFDEFATVFKTATFGVLALFFIIFIDDVSTGSPAQSRFVIAMYWALLIVSVGGGRILLRSFQRRLLEAGIGLRNSLIVGWNAKARELFDMVMRYPALGYKVVGFIKVDRRKGDGQYKRVRTLGSIDTLHDVIAKYEVKEILIALDSTEHDKLLGIIQKCNSTPVGLKIMPDLYDIISGQARTNQIYGFPLIEISPEIMPAWEQAAKRLIDVFVSLMILIVTFPISLIIALLIMVDSPGPIFYVQERVGKDGRPFRIFKFRSMHQDAEKHSGPVWANKRDPRVTRVGRIIRKLRIDEIPQFINVLAGEMSLVGPRPERPYFVNRFSTEIPLYARRLRVRPGITGWAQVKHKYDETLEDVKKKVRYDLFYIENMSLRMDFKILLNTVYVMLMGRGH